MGNKEIVDFISKSNNSSDLEIIRRMLNQIKEAEEKNMINPNGNPFDNNSSSNFSNSKLQTKSSQKTKKRSKIIPGITGDYYENNYIINDTSQNNNIDIFSQGGFVSALVLSIFTLIFSSLFMLVGYIIYI